MQNRARRSSMQRGFVAGPLQTVIVVVIALAAVAASPLAVRRADPRVKAAFGLLRQADAAPRQVLDLIIRESSPASADAERLVGRLGGVLTRELPMVGGFSARLPAGRLMSLIGSPAVEHVWSDASVHMNSLGMGDILDLGGASSAPA